MFGHFRFYIVLALMVGFFSKTTVLAQESPTDAQIAEARQLFVQGLELSDNGKWAEAAEHFRRVKAVKDAPPVNYNLALNLAELDQLGEANELLTSVLASPDAKDALKRQAKGLQQGIQKRAGRVTFRLTGDSSDVFLLMDGREIKDPTATQYVRPGQHTVVVERDEREILNKKIDVIKGAKTEVRMTILARKAPTGSPDLTVPDETPTLTDAEQNATVPVVDPKPGEKKPLYKDWRLWAGVAAGVVVVIAVVAIIAGSQRRAFDGNFQPGQLTFGSGQ